MTRTTHITIYFVRRLTVLMLLLISAHSTTAQIGCPTGPFSSCNDPTPSTNVNGPWTDYTSTWGLISQWSVTVSAVDPGGTGTVTGSVRVPSPATGCPDSYYSVSGNISPSSQIDSVDGNTPFSWTASSPNPSTVCGGYTPVSTMTYSGNIANKSNDRGTGTWSRPGASGPLTFWRAYIDPIGETTIADGFSQVPQIYTMARFRQELTKDYFGPPDPNSNLFQGRQVFEVTAPGVGSDACFTASSGMYPGGAFTSVTGAVWNVGYAPFSNKNTWGWDTVGWPAAGVAWYRQNIPSQLPCTATIPQTMRVVVNGDSTGNITYNTGTLVVTIGTTYIEVTRNGVIQTLNQ